jgi:hypothetical protein
LNIDQPYHRNKRWYIGTRRINLESSGLPREECRPKGFRRAMKGEKELAFPCGKKATFLTMKEMPIVSHNKEERVGCG